MSEELTNQPYRFRGFSVPSYTMCPDEIFDELLSILSGAQLKVTLYVVRRTFGFKKPSDNISISQMLYGIKTKDGRQLDRGVGLAKSTLLQAVRELTDMEVIIPTRRESAERGNEATNYRLNIVGMRSSGPLPRGNPSEPEQDGGPGTYTPLVRKSDQGESTDQTKGLVGKSDPQETVIQHTDKVVNTLSGNDPKKISEKGGMRRQPAISDRALRATYHLRDEQIAQVHYLVEKQIELLGAGVKNHGNYVKRAAEAVAAGAGQLLDLTLSDYKQAATAIKVVTPPAYFEPMWTEALHKRQNGPTRRATVPAGSSSQRQGFERAGDILDANTAHVGFISETDNRIARLIADAERRGLDIPEEIRRTNNYHQVTLWWATLVDHDASKSAR